MGNEMPKSADFTGLSRNVLRYSEEFLRVVNKLKQPGFSEADWAPFKNLAPDPWPKVQTLLQAA